MECKDNSGQLLIGLILSVIIVLLFSSCATGGGPYRERDLNSIERECHRRVSQHNAIAKSSTIQVFGGLGIVVLDGMMSKNNEWNVAPWGLALSSVGIATAFAANNDSLDHSICTTK